MVFLYFDENAHLYELMVEHTRNWKETRYRSKKFALCTVMHPNLTDFVKFTECDSQVGILFF